MSLSEHGLAYIKNQPFVIFEPTLATSLAKNGWDKLAKEKGISIEDYSIANCIGEYEQISGKQVRLVIDGTEEPIIEVPNLHRIQNFYEEHGLEPLTEAKFEANKVQEKLRRAFVLLQTVEPVADCIGRLVKTMQVLRQDDAEIDTSYSHPKIPFSVFVSVCEDTSLLSSLRVAESILHEAMHLQLTLLEDVIELIHSKSINLYFSPWRDEDRPARGILHGIFVFRAVHDFYITFSATPNLSEDVKEFLAYRIASIERELDSLKYFGQISDLTQEGKSLVCQLLKYGPTPPTNLLPLS